MTPEQADIIPPYFTFPGAPGEVVDYDPSTLEQPDEEPVPDAEPGTVLEIKHLHEVFDQMKHDYVIKAAPPQESSGEGKHGDVKYAVYAFTVIKKFIPNGNQSVKTFNVQTFLEIQSEPLISIGKEILGEVQGVSWTAKPLRVNPQTLLAQLGLLKAHSAKLTSEVQSAQEDSIIHLHKAHLDHLLKYLTTSYATTLGTLDSLIAHKEITFDLLWALFVPNKTTLYILCPITREPRAVRLVHAEMCQKIDQEGVVPTGLEFFGLVGGGKQNSDQRVQYLWRLIVDYVEADVPEPGEKNGTKTGFGYASLGVMLDVPNFTGTKKISMLPAYPIEYYAGPGGVEGLKGRLVSRGEKWVELAGSVHHLAYKGMAWQWSNNNKQYIQCSVNSRVVVDRKTFIDAAPNYGRLPHVTKTLEGEVIDRHALRINAANSKDTQRELTSDELMLTSPIVYGFSLQDKHWLEFAVELIKPFEWNDEAFQQLVIPTQHKTVLKILLESYNSHATANFDDFISGKGLGLVINLFGNPGTGKSLTAEAMSEHLRKPLYVVGAAELGTSAEALDSKLSSVLKVAASWGAVVLIDEADVFLEERSLHLIERNAMVAVFLRQLEYFRGILFLTTNRVRVFDEAFQSRIHVSLRYHDLNSDARRQIWIAFLRKVNGDLKDGGLSKEDLRDLGEKKINGRQIKNVVKTAAALAAGQQETLGYKHLMQVLELMEEFDARSACYALSFRRTYMLTYLPSATAT
ncbi:uncharacterized protein FIBRA_01926 [Fibroporia radiculosa]|uniref:AAA+ ATPase domain-containing protein n=1 Tax=Fibroporia radiculosa TaxID=599839 RepID=J4I8S1_9APHY|nr:uncharacterized protein FIBRA_01926 [Fibroporia radiculosa]CCL99901.1 predicted protein [Fibroporia radiculosa]